MSRKVFINLPVTDLKRAMAFFAALGFRHEPQFTNEQAACIVVSEHIHTMLLTHEFFAGFTDSGAGNGVDLDFRRSESGMRAMTGSFRVVDGNAARPLQVH